jgi:hydroxypyruvate reductase
MAAAVESLWPEDTRLTGLVVTRHGHGVPTKRIRVIEAGHPLPDQYAAAASTAIFDIVASASPDDMLLVLLSGGGSSLLSHPENGLTLTDLRQVTQDLLHSGAPIEAINCIRKHLSRGLGGKLARHCQCPARVLLISDVVGDDPSVIASGPFHPDESTFADAMSTLVTWGIQPSQAIHDFLRHGHAGLVAETAKPKESCFNTIDTRIIGNARMALDAAANYFNSRGIGAVILDDSVTEEARVAALGQAELAARCATRGQPWKPPVALLSGGETRVRVQGHGRGGRNSEFLLALARQLQDSARIYAMAADTDGIDGTEDNAGAFWTPDLWHRARQLGLDADLYLENNDAHGFFSALDALVVTGPTGTNVNDYRAILIT